MDTLPLLVVEPPYTMVRWLRDVPPALGSIALIDCVETRPSAAQVRSLMDVAPWCPTAILGCSKDDSRRIPRSPHVCLATASDGVQAGEDSRAILHAVEMRPRPTLTDLVDWLLRRTRMPSMRRTLADLFSRPLLRKSDLAFLPQSYKDQIRQLGAWSALDWQHAVQLADIAADRTILKRVLAAQDSHSTDLRGRMLDLLGTSERHFHEMYGWEWVLEASLRRSGFFGAQAVTARQAGIEGEKTVVGHGRGRWAGRGEIVAAYDSTQSGSGYGEAKRVAARAG